MSEVGAEALLGAEAPAERLERPHRDFLLRAAAPADEVAVPLDVGAVPARDAIVEMCMSDVPELLEGLKVAVDGGGIDLWVARADGTGDLLRRGVMARSL